MKRRDLLLSGLFSGVGVALTTTAPSFATGIPGPARKPAGTDNVVIADFEGPDWAGWAVGGTAFGPGPVRGAAELAALEIQGFHGDGVASSERAGDGPTGTLTSAEFTINRRYIAYGVGGGDYEYVTCLNLLVDGVVVRSATGRTTDLLTPGSWDVTEFAGRKARIQLVDQATGDWGHVNCDHVIMTDQPERPPETTQPRYAETWRPRVHFTARQWAMDRLNPGQRQEGWLNDLNGLVFYDGEYHLFAQRWNKCWLHAVSTDLVHWSELPPAFFEEALGTGVQSGSVVIDYGNTSGLSPDPGTPPMVAFWTRNDNQSQCLSFSVDHGRTWTHHPGNPILVHTERDPKVFRYEPGGHWVMLLYGEQQYHVLVSDDLLHWTDTGNQSPGYECPDFFELPLDGDAGRKKWVMVRGSGSYSTGTFDGRKFTEETAQSTSDTGANFYATQTWNNTETGDGRRLQAAWMRGGVYPNMPFNQQVTFPCELSLRTVDGRPRLLRTPVTELSRLHNGMSRWSGLVRPGATVPLTTGGDAFDIRLSPVIPAGASLVLNVFGVPITITAQSVENGSGAQPLSTPLRDVRVLVDRTSIEVFANDGEVSISRCYLPNAGGIMATATGAAVSVPDITTYSLASIWPRSLP